MATFQAKFIGDDGEPYCPGCETGCENGHTYGEEVCCFRNPGVTWADFYMMMEEESDYINPLEEKGKPQQVEKKKATSEKR